MLRKSIFGIANLMDDVAPSHVRLIIDADSREGDVETWKGDPRIMVFQDAAMRLPRMTTRRWMVTAAVIAMAFGAYRETRRLKQRRDAYLMRAAWHAEAEAHHRGLLATLTMRAVSRASADQGATPLPATNSELDKLIEREFGLPSSSSIPSEGDYRFQEAQARQTALAGLRSKIQDDYDRRMSSYHARQADLDAALARRYRYAASRPWLSVEPDPPVPEP